MPATSVPPLEPAWPVDALPDAPVIEVRSVRVTDVITTVLVTSGAMYVFQAVSKTPAIPLHAAELGVVPDQPA